MTRATRFAPPAALLATVACTSAPAEQMTRASPASTTTTAASVLAAREVTAPAVASSKPSAVLATFPHDVTSFTEGMLYDRGTLYESTGLYGESKLRKIDLITGRVLAQVKLADAYFGEGLALLRGELYQLTYRERRCFVYDAATLEKRRELTYDGEGWGLTTDGTSFLMSDGSPVITFRDPAKFQPVRRITVTGARGPIANINELEWVDGYILANVWETNMIVRVDPASGRVVQVLDFAYLPEPRRGAVDDNVLNGIAYDAETGRLFVTGKRWSQVFQVPKP